MMQIKIFRTSVVVMKSEILNESYITIYVQILNLKFPVILTTEHKATFQQNTGKLRKIF
jgi:hypothetical protein